MERERVDNSVILRGSVADLSAAIAAPGFGSDFEKAKAAAIAATEASPSVIASRQALAELLRSRGYAGEGPWAKFLGDRMTRQEVANELSLVYLRGRMDGIAYAIERMAERLQAIPSDDGGSDVG